MTTDLTVINTYPEFDSDDMEHLIKANQSLEVEVKRLRKEKDNLIEQLALLKKFSDGLWNNLRIDI